MSDDLVVGRITFLDARAAEIVRLESALEAKDAEIERLKSGWHDCISDLTAAQKRAEQAERALAEAVEVLRPFAEIREALELISANKPGDVLQDERAIEEGGVNGIFLERHRGHVVPGRILLTM